MTIDFFIVLLKNRNNRFAFISFGIKTNCDRNDVITYELLNAKQYYAYSISQNIGLRSF